MELPEDARLLREKVIPLREVEAELLVGGEFLREEVELPEDESSGEEEMSSVSRILEGEEPAFLRDSGTALNPF